MHYFNNKLGQVVKVVLFEWQYLIMNTPCMVTVRVSTTGTIWSWYVPKKDDDYQPATSCVTSELPESFYFSFSLLFMFCIRHFSLSPLPCYILSFFHLFKNQSICQSHFESVSCFNPLHVFFHSSQLISSPSYNMLQFPHSLWNVTNNFILFFVSSLISFDVSHPSLSSILLSHLSLLLLRCEHVRKGIISL